MADRLFISHASDDDAVVSRIVAYLEANGRRCWIASRDIPPQSIYADAIAEGMQECAACVVILSAASNQSKAVKRELELASHYDKPFIPIRVDSAEPGRGFDYYLRNAQWLDYGRHGEGALDRIVGRSAASPNAPPRAAPPSSPSVEAKSEPGGRLFVIAGGIAVTAMLTIWAGVALNAGSPQNPAVKTEVAPAEPSTTDTAAQESKGAPQDAPSGIAPVASVVGSWDPAPEFGDSHTPIDFLPNGQMAYPDDHQSTWGTWTQRGEIVHITGSEGQFFGRLEGNTLIGTELSPGSDDDRVMRYIRH